MAGDVARLKQLLPLISSAWKVENGVIKDESGTWLMQLYGSPGVTKEEHDGRLELVTRAMNSLASLLEENETSTGISTAIEKVVAGIVGGLVEEKIKTHVDKMHVPWGE